MKKAICFILLLWSLAACNNQGDRPKNDTDTYPVEVDYNVDSAAATPDTARTAPRSDTMQDTLRVRFPDRK